MTIMIGGLCGVQFEESEGVLQGSWWRCRVHSC